MYHIMFPDLHTSVTKKRRGSARLLSKSVSFPVSCQHHRLVDGALLIAAMGLALVEMDTMMSVKAVARDALAAMRHAIDGSG